MPASSTKKPVTAKGAKPAKSGSTAKAATTRLLVYARVNDEKNLRSYGSRTDAYAVSRPPAQD